MFVVYLNFFLAYIHFKFYRLSDSLIQYKEAMGMCCSKSTDETEQKTRYKKEEHKEKNERDHNKRTGERHGPIASERSKECVQPTETENTESVRHFAINSGIKVELDKGDEENMKQNNYIPPNIGNNKEKVC
jgi:hypothetical protein